MGSYPDASSLGNGSAGLIGRGGAPLNVSGKQFWAIAFSAREFIFWRYHFPIKNEPLLEEFEP